ELLAKPFEIELIAVLFDRDVRPVRGRQDKPGLLDLQEQADVVRGIGRRVEGSLGARHLLVDLQPRELFPHRRHEEEHDAAEEQVDERDERDLAVDALLPASAATCTYSAHLPFSFRSWRPARRRAGAPTSASGRLL